MLDQRQLLRPGRLDGSKSTLARLVDGVHEFAVHVELQLNGSGVADAHRRGAVITRQPRYLPFGELPFTRQAIHDLELVWASRHSAREPSSPCLRLLAIPCRIERHKRQGRVAQPAIAIVPVALAAELLR